MNFSNLITKTNIFLSGLFILFATTMLVLAASIGLRANAIPYNGNNTPPSPVPAFNVYTGVPSQGNEADFYRGKVDGSAGDRTNDVQSTCETGTRFSLTAYVHNGASQNANNNGTGPSVAQNTRIMMTVPGAAGSTFGSTSTITSSNAATVSDDLSITCTDGRTVTVSYVPGSAQQFSKLSGYQAVSDSIVTPGGAPIGTMAPNGQMWGCWDQRVWVEIIVEVTEVQQPEEPVYVCEVVSLAFDDRKARFTIRPVVANGATFKQATFTYVADGNAVNVDTVTQLDGSGNAMSMFEFANGSERISASAKMAFNLPDGSMPEVDCGSGDNVLGVVTPPEPPVIIPVTGAGSTLAGILAAVAGAGAIAHRKLMLRRQ